MKIFSGIGLMKIGVMVHGWGRKVGWLLER